MPGLPLPRLQPTVTQMRRLHGKVVSTSIMLSLEAARVGQQELHRLLHAYALLEGQTGARATEISAGYRLGWLLSCSTSWVIVPIEVSTQNINRRKRKARTKASPASSS